MSSETSTRPSKPSSRDNPKAEGKWDAETDWVWRKKWIPRCHAKNRFGERCGSPAMNSKNVCRKHGGKAGRKAGTPNPHKVRHGLFQKILSEPDLESYTAALTMTPVEKLEHISALIMAKVTNFLLEKGEKPLDKDEETALGMRLAELRRLSEAIHKMEKDKPAETDDDITTLLTK